MCGLRTPPASSLAVCKVFKSSTDSEILDMGHNELITEILTKPNARFMLIVVQYVAQAIFKSVHVVVFLMPLTVLCIQYLEQC